MKKILLLLLSTIAMYGQIPADATQLENIQLTNNTQDVSAQKVIVQDSDGVLRWDFQSNLKMPTKEILSTGLLKNGLISINSDPTKFNVSAGIGIISNFDNPEAPTSIIVNFPAFTAVAPTYLTTGNITYIAVNNVPAIVMQATPFTPIQRRDLIILGAVVHSNFTNINTVNNISAPSNASTNQLHDFIEAVGALNLTGNKYTANGANLSLNKSAGSIFKFGTNFAVDWKKPHEVSQAAGTALTFRYRTQNGTEGSDVTSINPAVYDLNNVLTAVPNNKFSIQTVTMFQTGLTRIQYGQNYYDDLPSAKAAIFTRNFNVESNIKENGVTRAYVIVKNNATSLQNISDADIVEAQKFGGIASGGVALTLANVVTALGYTPENMANKGVANGYASLGADGKVPNSQIPALAISETFPVSSQAEMLSLSQAEQGDVAIRSDISKSFILRQSPSSILANWSELLTPTSAVTSVNGQVGVVNLTTTDIPDSTNKRYQTDAQQTNNDATSSIQTQLDLKANDSDVLHTTGNETKSGTLTLNNQLRLNNGTPLNPSIVFYDDESVDTGINHINNGEIQLITNGFNNTRILPTGVTSLAFVKTGGLATQYLKADGSVSTLTNPITGTGSTNRMPKFTGTSSISDGVLTDMGTYIAINQGSGYGLNVGGDITGSFYDNVSSGGHTFYSNNGVNRLVDFLGSGVVKVTGLAGSGDRVLTANSAGELIVSTAPTAPTAALGTNTTQIATTAFVSANSRPYKVYTALLTQTGTNAPVATVLENTLGGAVVWSRSGTGNYSGTLAGAFTADKTTFLSSAGFSTGVAFINGAQSTVNNVVLYSSTSAGSFADGILLRSTIEIRVYN